MPSKLEERVTQHDREIAAIRKLIITGMKMLARHDRQIDAMVAGINRLSVAQRETDRQLKLLVSSLTRGSNGHSKN